MELEQQNLALGMGELLVDAPADKRGGACETSGGATRTRTAVAQLRRWRRGRRLAAGRSRSRPHAIVRSDLPLTWRQRLTVPGGPKHPQGGVAAASRPAGFRLHCPAPPRFAGKTKAIRVRRAGLEPACQLRR